MLKWCATLIASIGCLTTPADAQVCNKTEAACVLDAAWSAALMLPTEKHDRLAPAFHEIAQLSGDSDLILFWNQRLPPVLSRPANVPDYGWRQAEPILDRQGVEGLIQMATERKAPLHYGRADVLLSAGRKLHADNPTAALRLNRALLDIHESASDFEKPNLLHAAAELAMTRCDAVLFAQLSRASDAMGNLRYAFWRARIHGNASDVIARLRRVDSEQDTRYVRRALEGYRAILELGYCPQDKSEIGE